MKKRKRKLKVKNIVLAILILIFLFAVITLIIFFLDLSKNKGSYKALIKEVIEYVPTSNSRDDGEQELIFKVNFEKLKNINSDTVGWIRFNQDKVNNPIVQAVDNYYYLKRSFEKQSNQVGTIFMDYRNNSFDDRNVVLFGHSIYDESMFGSLKNVLRDDFFDTEENRYILINDLNNNILKYEIFSYYVIDKEEYYIMTSFNSDSSFMTFLNTIASRSYRNFDVKLSPSDKVLTLSTCAGTGDTPERMVIHAKRV